MFGQGVAAFYRLASPGISKRLAVATRERHHESREPMPELGIRVYTRHRGVSNTAVEKAIQQGRIRTTASGLIDAEQADQDWSRSTASNREPGTAPSYSQNLRL